MSLLRRLGTNTTTTMRSCLHRLLTVFPVAIVAIVAAVVVVVAVVSVQWAIELGNVSRNGPHRERRRHRSRVWEQVPPEEEQEEELEIFLLHRSRVWEQVPPEEEQEEELEIFLEAYQRVRTCPGGSGKGWQRTRLPQWGRLEFTRPTAFRLSPWLRLWSARGIWATLELAAPAA